MKKLLFLTFLSFILVGCQWGSNDNNEANNTDANEDNDVWEDGIQPSQEEEIESQLPEGTFAKGGTYGYEGEAYVEGYTTMVTTPKASCALGKANAEEECKNETFKAVFFNITGVNNPAFQNYLDQYKNTPMSDRISLGCLEDDNKIRYTYGVIPSGKTEPEMMDLDESMGRKILEADSANPVVLRVEKFSNFEGSPPPDCLSFFKVLEVQEA